MEKIIKLESEMGAKLLKASQDSLMNDLRAQFVHEGKVLIQERMRLQEAVAAAQASIELIDLKTKAIEEGRVSFDLRTGKILYPEEINAAQIK